MNSVKILINGIAGAGKTSLLSTLGEETFVVSRDAKKFGLEIPHLMVDEYVDMHTLIEGEGGIVPTMEKYHKKFNRYPENVAIDSVSQITMDVIDKASQTPNVYGSQGAEITKEMAMLVKFIHEDLELNGINVILLNHVIPEKDEGKETGAYTQFGQGKFLAKGGFYAATNEALTVVPSGNNRVVYMRGTDKQARTTLNDLPDKMYVENYLDPTKSRKLKDGEVHFNLKEHIERLLESQVKVGSWSL